MRGIFALIAVAAALALAGAGAGATVTVTITKNGYVPLTASIVAGDTVQFTNSDTVAHQIVFKPTTGITCTANPLVIQPTKTASCTFATAGNYAYSDPNVKTKAFQGTVKVAAAAGAAAVTLAAAPQAVVYSGKVTLSGTLKSGQTGQNVQVLAQSCGAGPAKAVASTTTTTGGAYTVAVQPLQNTVYTVKVKGATSNAGNVQVRPRLRLGKIAAHRYSARIFASASFAGRQASFQRYKASTGRWVRVRLVTFRAMTTGVAPTVVSGVNFRSSLGAGRKVRLAISQSSVGACYLAGTSNTIRS
jgi:plastocyanin